MVKLRPLLSKSTAYQAGERASKTYGSAGRRKPNTKKSDCHIHATLKQRLDAVHKLRHQYDIKTLCRVLRINRSTYYKHFYSDLAPRTKENPLIRKHLLQIYTDYDNSLGAYKIRRVLERDYGINISLGRVDRLMNTMNLPKRSTEKPKWKGAWKDNGPCE